MAFMGFAGLNSAPADWLEAENLATRILAGFITCYGVVGILAAAALIFRRKWAIWPLGIFFVAGLISATLANLIFASKGSMWWILILAFLLGWTFYSMFQYVRRELSNR